MKKLIVLVAFTPLLLVACKKDNVVNETVVMPPSGGGASGDTAAMLKFRGMFIDGTYGSTSGVVKIFEAAGKYTLVLDSFMVNNGPDLHVYLSQEVEPLTFIDLGKLKANSGKQVYNIANMPDFAKFRYALIHCQQFNHLFGSASLVK